MYGTGIANFHLQRTSKIMIPAPSPITNPDLWLSNGRDDSSGRSLNLVVSARILVREIKTLLVILRLSGRLSRCLDGLLLPLSWRSYLVPRSQCLTSLPRPWNIWVRDYWGPAAWKAFPSFLLPRGREFPSPSISNPCHIGY